MDKMTNEELVALFSERLQCNDIQQAIKIEAELLSRLARVSELEKEVERLNKIAWDCAVEGQRAIDKLERIRLCMIEFNEFTAREKVKELKEILAEEG